MKLSKINLWCKGIAYGTANNYWRPLCIPRIFTVCCGQGTEFSPDENHCKESNPFTIFVRNTTAIPLTCDNLWRHFWLSWRGGRQRRLLPASQWVGQGEGCCWHILMRRTALTAVIQPKTPKVPSLSNAALKYMQV